MAPLKDQETQKVMENRAHDELDDKLKQVFTEIQSMGQIAHGYENGSVEHLIRHANNLTGALQHLTEMVTPPAPPAPVNPNTAPLHNLPIPPEVLDYVAAGRNPDIYTREFVENAQRGNRVMAGKMSSLADFAVLNANETRNAVPEMREEMDALMRRVGGEDYEQGEDGNWKRSRKGGLQRDAEEGKEGEGEEGREGREKGEGDTGAVNGGFGQKQTEKGPNGV